MLRGLPTLVVATLKMVGMLNLFDTLGHDEDAAESLAKNPMETG